ncbi:UNVERIFIED_CONTAM: hypothetical protein K2H54_058910 [Gekko kuhli]
MAPRWELVDEGVWEEYLVWIELGQANTSCMLEEALIDIPRLYEELMEELKVRNHLHTLKQGWKTMLEYSEEFKRYVAKVQGWLDGVLAEQYFLGLSTELSETMLGSVHPISLNAWMREAADVESHLQMIQIDNAGGTPGVKPKQVKPKEGV